MSKENKGAREFIVNKPHTGFYGPDNWFELPNHRAWKVELDNTVNGLTGEWYHFVEKKDLEKCQAEKVALEQRLTEAEKQLAVAIEALGIIKHYKSRNGDDVQSELARNAINKIEEMNETNIS